MATNRLNGRQRTNDLVKVVNSAFDANPRLILNDMGPFTRAFLFQMLQGELPFLDVDRECRYPRQLTITDYAKAYARDGVATRTVAIYPEECWAMPPEIYETEELSNVTPFEEAWEALEERCHILTNLQTVDEVSGIGQYGILLLGFDDGREPNSPAFMLKSDGTKDTRFKNLNLLYVRPISQQFVRINKYETDTKNPRYGQPVEYQINFADPNALLTASEVQASPQWTEVHWTRVIHVADNRKNSDIIGVPRLQDVFNDILNIRKILGANGQGYWSGGFPGISIETQPNIDTVEFDKKATKEQIQKYVDGLQRYLALEGLTAKSLTPQIADPTNHYNTHLGNLCAAKGVPLRVFKGSEEAKLASSQDMRTWNKRLARRQNQYITPYILREFFNRLFIVGALPRPKKLFIKWPDLNAPTENDRATTAQKITDSLVKYITGNCFVVMPPKEYLVLVLGYPQPQVEAILKQANITKMMAILNKMAKMATQPQANTQSSSMRGRKAGVTKTKKVSQD